MAVHEGMELGIFRWYGVECVVLVGMNAVDDNEEEEMWRRIRAAPRGDDTLVNMLSLRHESSIA